jgi:general stress protein CsbA
MSYVIRYSRHPAVLEGYSDSNWISNIDQIYATSGYVFTLEMAQCHGGLANKIF